MEAHTPFQFVMAVLKSHDVQALAPEFSHDIQAWKRVAEIAQRMEVLLPVLSSIVQSAWFDGLSDEIGEFLQGTLIQHEIENHRIESEFKNILMYFNEAKIPLLLLGDLDLSRRYYTGSIRRSVHRIQIIVPKQHQYRVFSLLGGAGYKLDKKLRMELGQSFRLSRHKFGIQSPGFEIIMDDGAFFSRAEESLWQSSLGFEDFDSDHRYAVLTDEANFMVHLRTVQFWKKSKSPGILSDLNRIMNTEQGLDWGQILSAIRAQGMESTAYRVLHRLKREWNASVPTQVMLKLKDESRLFTRLKSMKGTLAIGSGKSIPAPNA